MLHPGNNSTLDESARYLIKLSMHFWIDKRSPYGFGRSRVTAGTSYGQYPRRLMRPSKPWSQTHNHRSTTNSNSSTPNDGADPHAHGGGESLPHMVPLEDSSPSYFKWFLWAIAIALSTFLIYIICDSLYHVYLLFTFCALLIIFFLLGVCTVSNVFRRTPGPDATNIAVPPEMSQQQSLESHHEQQQQQQQHQNLSPSISIHNLAESPKPTYHNNNQYSPPPYHIALDMHKSSDETSLPSYDKIQPE